MLEPVYHFLHYLETLDLMIKTIPATEQTERHSLRVVSPSSQNEKMKFFPLLFFREGLLLLLLLLLLIIIIIIIIYSFIFMIFSVFPFHSSAQAESSMRRIGMSLSSKRREFVEARLSYLKFPKALVQRRCHMK